MNHMDLFEAKRIYNRGENITKYLREKFGQSENTSEIIEAAYDLQAGSYIKRANSNRKKEDLYTSEVAKILDDHILPMDSLVDIGAGELTTLTLTLNKSKINLSFVLAFDISWSRIFLGKKFFIENNCHQDRNLDVFVADIKSIPLQTKSVDVVTSNHALEPNGKNLPALLMELFRITKRKLVLFEPSYELNSEEGKSRMDSLGYIREIEQTVVNLDGKILDIIPMKNVANPLNPTACYVIKPPSHTESQKEKPTLSVPGTDFKLSRSNTFLCSEETGLIFPILENIPILRDQYGILATAKF